MLWDYDNILQSWINFSTIGVNYFYSTRIVSKFFSTFMITQINFVLPNLKIFFLMWILISKRQTPKNRFKDGDVCFKGQNKQNDRFEKS